MGIITYRNIEPSDYDQLYSLWDSSSGIGLSMADSPDSIRRYLQKNTGNSFAAFSKNLIVGSILAGDDGRRGYLHHLMVHSNFRRMGIGRTLVDKAVKRLEAKDIDKCHIFIFSDNQEGISFWKRIGWEYREDIAVMSFSMAGKDKTLKSDTQRTC